MQCVFARSFAPEVARNNPEDIWMYIAKGITYAKDRTGDGVVMLRMSVEFNEALKSANEEIYWKNIDDIHSRKTLFACGEQGLPNLYEFRIYIETQTEMEKDLDILIEKYAIDDILACLEKMKEIKE